VALWRGKVTRRRSATAGERMGVFANGRFRLLYAATLTSTLGSTFSPIALSFAALDLTGSAADLGYVLAASMVPRILLLLVGGTVADRWSRNAIMVASSLTSALAQVLTVLAMLTGAVRFWELLALAATTSAAGAFFAPAAQGVIPELVTQAWVHQANVQIRIAMNGCLLAGPALAGVLIAATSPAWAILIDAVSYLAAAPMLLRLRLATRPHRPDASMLRLLQEGWRAFWSRSWLWSVVLQSSCMNMAYFTSIRLFGPLEAQQHYGGATAWGLVLSANGVGYILGGLLSLWFKPGRLLLTGVCAASGMALPVVALAVVAPLWLVLCAAAVCGVMFELMGVAWAVTMQQHLPRELLSRASAFDILGSDLLMPVGYLTGGVVASALGTGATLWLCAGLILAPTALVLCNKEVRTLRQPVQALPQPISATA